MSPTNYCVPILGGIGRVLTDRKDPARKDDTDKSFSAFTACTQAKDKSRTSRSLFSPVPLLPPSAELETKSPWATPNSAGRVDLRHILRCLTLLWMTMSCHELIATPLTINTLFNRLIPDNPSFTAVAQFLYPGSCSTALM